MTIGLDKNLSSSILTSSGNTVSGVGTLGTGCFGIYDQILTIGYYNGRVYSEFIINTNYDPQNLRITFGIVTDGCTDKDTSMYLFKEQTGYGLKTGKGLCLEPWCAAYASDFTKDPVETDNYNGKGSIYSYGVVMGYEVDTYTGDVYGYLNGTKYSLMDTLPKGNYRFACSVHFFRCDSINVSSYFNRNTIKYMPDGDISFEEYLQYIPKIAYDNGYLYSYI